MEGVGVAMVGVARTWSGSRRALQDAIRKGNGGVGVAMVGVAKEGGCNTGVTLLGLI